MRRARGPAPTAPRTAPPRPGSRHPPARGAGAAGPPARRARPTAPAPARACPWRRPAAAARFASARLDGATVMRLGDLLGTVIAGLVAPGARLEAISPLTAAERARVVVEWNRTATGYRTDATAHGLFREQAAADPDRIA